MNRQFPGRDLHPLVICAFVAHQDVAVGHFLIHVVTNSSCVAESRKAQLQQPAGYVLESKRESYSDRIFRTVVLQRLHHTQLFLLKLSAYSSFAKQNFGFPKAPLNNQ